MRGSNGGTPGSTAVLSFLNSVLSARGPNALPYMEEHKWSIREQVMQLHTVRGLAFTQRKRRHCVHVKSCLDARPGLPRDATFASHTCRTRVQRVEPLTECLLVLCCRAAIPVAVALQRPLHTQRRPHSPPPAGARHTAHHVPGAWWVENTPRVEGAAGSCTL